MLLVSLRERAGDRKAALLAGNTANTPTGAVATIVSATSQPDVNVRLRPKPNPAFDLGRSYFSTERLPSIPSPSANAMVKDTGPVPGSAAHGQDRGGFTWLGRPSVSHVPGASR
jgi:hypothetical protein